MGTDCRRRRGGSKGAGGGNWDAAVMSAGAHGMPFRRSASGTVVVWETSPKHRAFLPMRARLSAGARGRFCRWQRSQPRFRRQATGLSIADKPGAFGLVSATRIPCGEDGVAGCRRHGIGRSLHGGKRRNGGRCIQGRNARRREKSTEVEESHEGRHREGRLRSRFWQALRRCSLRPAWRP